MTRIRAADFVLRQLIYPVQGALPSVPEAKLRDHVFVDIGAGLGMASYCVKALFGMRPVTVEPSYTGKISHQVLGRDVHCSYFEHSPEQLLAASRKSRAACT